MVFTCETEKSDCDCVCLFLQNCINKLDIAVGARPLVTLYISSASCWIFSYFHIYSTIIKTKNSVKADIQSVENKRNGLKSVQKDVSEETHTSLKAKLRSKTPSIVIWHNIAKIKLFSGTISHYASYEPEAYLGPSQKPMKEHFCKK